MKGNEFLIQGKETEVRFAQVLVNQLGGEVSVSDTQTDITKHIDLFGEPSVQKGFRNKGRKYGIDVKGLKRNNRSEGFDENIHGIEIVNVHGKPGGLQGDADMFAFETQDYGILIGKNTLRSFVHKKIKQFEGEPYSKELYHMYRRPGRMDVIMKVKTIDLMALANKILSKQ